MMPFEWGNSEPLSSNSTGRAKAWVNVKGHRYYRYYRHSRRVNGRVVSEHYGRGELAVMAAESHKAERDLARAELECCRADRECEVLYRNVLAVEPGVLPVAIRAQRPKRLPVVLTKPEVRLVIDKLEGAYPLVAQLLYGSGLRLLESLRLRVKDLDFARNEVTVRQGKGNKDRVTMRPESLKPALVEHLEKVRRLHEKDVALGFVGVYFSVAQGRKLPGAATEWKWQYVFPSAAWTVDPRSGVRRRHHAHEGSMSR